MKTVKVFISTAALLVSTIAGAQYSSYSYNTPDERDVLQFGVKAGLNNSSLYDAQGQNFVAKPLFGPVFGGFLSIPLGKFIGIQPELLYSAKGYAGTGTTGEEQSSNTTTTITVKGSTSETVTGAGTPAEALNYSYVDRLNFIDIPVMLQLKPFPNLYLLGGPEYSYLLWRSYTFTQGITSTTTQQEFNNDNIRHNILGLIFGADINLNSNITLGGRVAWDEEDNNGNGTSELPRYRNFWGQATLGYRF